MPPEDMYNSPLTPKKKKWLITNFFEAMERRRCHRLGHPEATISGVEINPQPVIYIRCEPCQESYARRLYYDQPLSLQVEKKLAAVDWTDQGLIEMLYRVKE